MSDTTPSVPEVVAQKGMTIGDDNLETREVSVNVIKETADAQVVQPRESDPSKVNVHETFIRLDEVITDPSSPLAVQIPDAGRGSLDLPIHGLNGPTPQQFFDAAEAAAKKKGKN